MVDFEEDIVRYLSNRTRASTFRCPIPRQDSKKLGLSSTRLSALLASPGMWEWTAPNIGFEEPPWSCNKNGWVAIAGWDDFRDLCVKQDGTCVAFDADSGQVFYMADDFTELLFVLAMYEEDLSLVHEDLNITLSPQAVARCQAFLSRIATVNSKLVSADSFWKIQLDWLLSNPRGPWFWGPAKSADHQQANRG